MTWVGLTQPAKGLNSKAEVSLQKTPHLRAVASVLSCGLQPA